MNAKVLGIIGSILFFPCIDVFASKLDFRGKRYCELMTVNMTGFTINVDIYNTFAMNDCPEEEWSHIHAEKISDKMGFKKVVKRGPYFWTVDSIKSGQQIKRNVVKFNDLEMVRTTSLEVSITDRPSKPKPYEVKKIERNLAIKFNAQNKIYKLIDSEGHQYLMISYSNEKKMQSLDTLSNLASELNLPKGWKYEAKITDKILNINHKDSISVVQDEFGNKYIGM